MFKIIATLSLLLFFVGCNSGSGTTDSGNNNQNSNTPPADPLKDAQNKAKIADANKLHDEANDAVKKAGDLKINATALAQANTSLKAAIDDTAKFGDIDTEMTKVKTALNKLKADPSFANKAKTTAMNSYGNLGNDLKTVSEGDLNGVLNALEKLSDAQKNESSVKDALEKLNAEKNRRDLEKAKTSASTQITTAENLNNTKIDAKYDTAKTAFSQAIQKAKDSITAAKTPAEVQTALSALKTATDNFNEEVRKVDEEVKNKNKNNQKNTANKEQENRQKYEAQFSAYMTSFNNPQDPLKWALLGDGDQNKDDGKYDLPNNISEYITNNFNEIKKKNKFQKTFASAAIIGILASENNNNLDKAVFKLVGNKADLRIDATSAAHKTVKDKNLNMLYVPKFATGEVNGEKYILEELIDVDASHEFQENLYTNLFTKAKSDQDIKNKLTEMFKQVTTFACLNNFDDIKYDNLPLAKNIGKVILLDVERGGGNIMRLLNGEVSEFYVPSEYIDAVVKVAKDLNNNFCKKIAEATPDEIKNAKENGDKRYEFLKGFADFKVKRGIITGKEKFSDEDIKKAQDALTQDLDKKFVKLFLEDLNNHENHDSRVINFGSLQSYN